MNHLANDKNQIFQRKYEWARQNQAENLSQFSEEESSKLMEFCEARHRLHSQMARNARTLYCLGGAEHNELWGKVLLIQNLMGVRILDEIDTPYDSDLIEGCPVLGYLGSSEEEYYELAINYYCRKLGELNLAAEKFLTEFDRKHGTTLAPTGATRG